ncbi:hypothetical protein BSLG_006083 [Batrachochytrium salamandrivorans]|nr:hypothetical protein BSLG_006083 [Batrachochytrium salamandrivorans]
MGLQQPRPCCPNRRNRQHVGFSKEISANLFCSSQCLVLQESKESFHAGSWHSASQEQLSSQLDSWISTADITPNPNVQAIITRKLTQS